MRWTMMVAMALVSACGASPATDAASVAAPTGNAGCRIPSGEGWYLCLGAARARPHLVEELRAKTDTADDAATWAGGSTWEAAPLRDLLTHPPEHNGLVIVGPVAAALAELGDREAVPELVDLARRMENEYFTGWEEAVAALRRLGGPEAVDYARGFLVGLTDGTTAMGIDHVDEVLPIVLAADARDVLPALQALTSGGDEGFSQPTYEALIGARLRLGDEELVRRVRRALRGREDGDPFTPDYYAEGLDDAEDIPVLVFAKRWTSGSEATLRRARPHRRVARR